MTDQTLSAADILARIADTLETRRPENGGDPTASYSAKLLAKGPDSFLKKIGEEATELVMAALTHFNLRPEDVLAELARREGLSGLAEKASRPKD
jgi:phosphoribosyl-ATP pyrophosphohydrolase